LRMESMGDVKELVELLARGPSGAQRRVNLITNLR